MIEIAPSILSADLTNLGSEIEAVRRGGATLIHVDVMDGHFVPNLSFGLPIVKSLAAKSQVPLDVHLMIAEPARYAEKFVEAGARMVSVHVEADVHLYRTINSIKEQGARAGVAINPATPLCVLDEILQIVDHVLVMSVEPGFSGQKFVPTTIDKVRRLRRMLNERNLKTRIEVDGGVDSDNIGQVTAAGADIVVASTAIFSHPDRAQAVRELRERTIDWV